jgi:hypothetical protein
MTRQDDIEQELTISVVINGMRWLQWLDGIVTENRGYKKRTKKRIRKKEKKRKRMDTGWMKREETESEWGWKEVKVVEQMRGEEGGIMHERQLAVFLQSHLKADYLDFVQNDLTNIDSFILFWQLRFDYTISTGQGGILIVEQPVFAVRMTERG